MQLRGGDEQARVIALEERAITERRRVDHRDAAASDADPQRVYLAAIAQRPGEPARAGERARRVDAADGEQAFGDVFAQRRAIVIHELLHERAFAIVEAALATLLVVFAFVLDIIGVLVFLFLDLAHAGPFFEFVGAADQRFVDHEASARLDPFLDARAARAAQVPVPGRKDDDGIGRRLGEHAFPRGVGAELLGELDRHVEGIGDRLALERQRNFRLLEPQVTAEPRDERDDREDGGDLEYAPLHAPPPAYAARRDGSAGSRGSRFAENPAHSSCTTAVSIVMPP